MFQCILNAFSGEGGGIEDMCEILAKKEKKKSGGGGGEGGAGGAGMMDDVAKGKGV